MNILIIEDDDNITDMVKLAFHMRWPDANVISTQLGEEGLLFVEKEHLDLVILDLGLPDIHGFEVLKSIRLFSNVPIIILTVRAEEFYIVRGLESGANDYVVKPFRPLELMARAKALVRGQCFNEIDISINRGPFSFKDSLRKLDFNDKTIHLTQSEGQIMHMLLKNSGQIISYSSLAKALWGEVHPGSQETIQVYIRRLREKFEVDPANPKYLTNKHGLGYVLNLD
ncbi:MAG: response regulator transcription factor [Dehalogenimonas sp.]